MQWNIENIFNYSQYIIKRINQSHNIILVLSYYQDIFFFT